MAFRTRRFVEFYNTDAAGIVHFAAFFPWMESAEHELLRSLGISVLPRDHGDSSSVQESSGEESPGQGASSESADGPVTWPRVRACCDYSSAARFEDWLEIEVVVANVGRSSVRYEISFSRQAAEGSTLIARGEVTSVCCLLSPAGGLKKVEIPAWIRQKLVSV